MFRYSTGLSSICLATALWLQLPLCPVANVLEVPCPGCGMGRALYALATGTWAEAISLHPLSPFVPLLAGSHFLRLRRQYASNPEDVRMAAAVPDFVYWAASVALLSVWISRFFGAFGGPVEVHSLLH